MTCCTRKLSSFFGASNLFSSITFTVMKLISFKRCSSLKNLVCKEKIGSFVIEGYSISWPKNKKTIKIQKNDKFLWILYISWHHLWDCICWANMAELSFATPSKWNLNALIHRYEYNGNHDCTSILFGGQTANIK